MDWETSNQMGENTAAESGTDGEAFDGFGAAFADLDAGDQRGESERPAEDGQSAVEDQHGATQEGGAGNAEPEPAAAEPPQPEMVTLKNGDYTADLPAAAVRQIAEVLGVDPVALMQKGMSYDTKAEREMRLLSEYAEAAGMNLPQYVEQLERNRDEMRLNAEMERLRNEFPDTPDGALTEIAKGRLSAAKMQQMQQAQAQKQQMDAVQQRIQQTLADTKAEQQRRGMLELHRVSGIDKAEDMPERVFALIAEGVNPVAAWWQHKAEEAQAAVDAAKKQNENRAQSPGSMAGSGADEKDPFLAGFFENY